MITVGTWQDTVYHMDGRIEVKPWAKNQIQNSHPLLLAKMMKEHINGSYVTCGGVNYFAVGEGLTSWDYVPPTKSYAAVALQTEIVRYSISQEFGISYLDPDDGVSIVAGPTRMIQIVVTIPVGLTASLREFALFGGDASHSLDSGYMLNWITHPVIEKDTSMRIQRVIRLKYLTAEEVFIL